MLIIMPYLLADTHVKTNEQYQILIRWVHKLAEDDDVILLGDILDFTKTPFMELEYVVSDFDHPHIYYIYGNHDIIAKELGFKCYDQLKYDGILFEHGHRFEALLRSTRFITPEEYNEMYKRVCYELNTDNILAKISLRIRRSIIHMKRNFNRQSMSRELFRHISKIGNIVVGHTHYELYSKTKRVLICDDAKIPDLQISRKTITKNKPIGYYLRTDTFDIERFELNTRSDIRPALNAKRKCLHSKS